MTDSLFNIWSPTRGDRLMELAYQLWPEILATAQIVSIIPDRDETQDDLEVRLRENCAGLVWQDAGVCQLAYDAEGNILYATFSRRSVEAAQAKRQSGKS